MDNDSMKVTMVIPSYWSRDSNAGWKEGDSVYDHPTPLDTDGTLARTIKSIDILNDKEFRLVIIAASTSKDIEKQVENKISGIVKSVSPDVETYIFGYSHIRQIHDLFVHEGQKEHSALLNLHGYPNIRNLCTFIPHVLGSDIALLIDDDEVFEDQNFVSKVKDFVGKNVYGEIISGVTGYIINSDGNYKVKKSFHPWMKYWDKNDRMNETFDNLIGKGPRLKKTSFALGGNMVIHRNLFSVVPFDPNVPRGEDTDFLINAMMFGFNFLLDNQLAIRHLPPKKSHPVWMRIREDIYRFVYERAKINHQKDTKGMTCVYPEDFDPYPGCFLKSDLEEKVKKSCELLSEKYLAQGDIQGSKDTLYNIDIVKSDAVPKYDPFERLCLLQKHWEKLMKYSNKNKIRSHIQEIIKG